MFFFQKMNHVAFDVDSMRLGCMKIRSAFSDELTAKRVAGTAYFWQVRCVQKGIKHDETK